MLRDEDRIFKNLYNDLGADLNSSKKRGDWTNTKDLCEKGRDWIIDEIKKSKQKRARTRIKTSGNSEMEYIVPIYRHEYFMLRDKIRCFLIQTPMFPQQPSLIQQIAPRCQHL